MTPVSLTSSIIGAAAAPRSLLFLHGIYGRGRNWAPVARDLVAAHPTWRARMVDLRHHGDSPRPGPPFSIEACARDVLDLLHEESASVVLIGHSFGGKVALQAAALEPGLVSQVWVIDSTPATKSPGGSAWRMLDVVESLPPDFTSRQEAVDGIVAGGFDPAVAAWMSANLTFTEGRYRWKIDFAVMRALMDDFFRLDLWDVIEAPPAGLDIHVVKATESSTIDEAAVQRITAAAATSGAVHLHLVEGGHWLNTDNPEHLLALFEQHLS